MSSLLALDSSSEILVVALVHAGGVFCHEGEGGPKASERMLPQAQALLGQAGLTLAQLDAIAFAAGPGAFTGLRTACAVAQGLAFGAGKPVLALDSLQLLAEDFRLQQAAALRPDQLLWVTVDARMDEIYAAAYTWQGERWQTVQVPALFSVDSLLQCWAQYPPAAVAGNALDAFAALTQALAVSSCPQQAASRSRAQALLSLARQAWDQGLQLDAAQAMPVYVRDKVALTTEERLVARAST